MKTQFLLVLATFLAFTFGCNNSPKDTTGNNAPTINIIDGIDINEKLDSKANLLVDMSQLVPIEDIAKALSLDLNQIKKVPSRTDNMNTCFFKWEDPNFPNTGIMMQIKTNPYPLDLPDWAMASMNSLRQNGEAALGETYGYRYKDLDGMATEGLYNADIGKYYWRLTDKVILFLAFNTIHEQEEQFQIATEIGTHMIKNYLDI